nr:reverse transcriptase domain-containing protein [Tanacetum cinerariifolium]
MPRECLAIIESKSKVRYTRNKPVVTKVSTNTSTSGISPDVAELKDMVKALLLDKKSQNQAPAIVKAVEESCVTCGGAHSYRNCPATDGNIYHDNIQEFVSQTFAVNYNQGNTSYRPTVIKAECLALADLGASINLMPLSVWNKLSLPDLTPTCMTLELADHSISRPVGVAKDVYVKVEDLSLRPEDLLLMCSKTLTLFENNDFLLKEVDAFLAIKDDPTSPEVDQSYLDPEGEILLLEAFLNDDPSLPPPNQEKYLSEVRRELKICEAKSDKSSIDKPPEVELTDLPPTSNTHSWKVMTSYHIITKDLSVEEKTALITVLKSYK